MSKLGYWVAAAARGVAVVGFMGMAAGCATTGGAGDQAVNGGVSERLDPDTATTVTILSRPVELLSPTTQQTGRTGVYDPFAYLAPFETDKAGSRELYLWVSTPQAKGVPQMPRVLCNGEALSIEPLSGAPKVDLSQLNLSRVPYDAPVPWSAQWYFKLSEDGLKCLSDASSVAVEAQAMDGSPTQFVNSEKKTLASLDAFTRR
jgi:hypothetical protein